MIFLVFDRKFLHNPTLFQKAINCGIIIGGLFPANARNQLILEQININDDVFAIEYSEQCNLKAFRHYTTYRYLLIPYEILPPPSPCGVNGRTPPSNPFDPPPCTGDIDIRFGSMLVTNQTSARSKSWIDLLTDEVRPSVHQTLLALESVALNFRCSC